MLADVIIIFIALLSAYSLRYGEVLPIYHLKNAWPIFPASVIAGTVYAWMLSIPKISIWSRGVNRIRIMPTNYGA